MSGSISASSSGLTNPALSSAATAALSNAAPTAAQAAAATGSSAITALTGNYKTFLNMLMTQLKNQDPTSPMDTNQFTTELVQFSSVEQQINTNSSLTQLIQLTQSGDLLQSSAMVGHTVAAGNTDMPVQNGSGQIQFTAAGAGPVSVTVFDSAGKNLGTSAVTATAGVNAWSWNAQDSNGTTQPNGDYKVVVTSTNAAGTSTTLPTDAVGVATGVVANSGTLQLQMGAVTTDFSNVQAVLN